MPLCDEKSTHRLFGEVIGKSAQLFVPLAVAAAVSVLSNYAQVLAVSRG